MLYDRQGDAHYDTISAFIKTVRDSDPDGALYWLARMLEAGEDPLFVARRLVVLAAEDVGLADPGALPLAVACQQATHFLGMPEARLPLAETTIYLARAPKSNSAYAAYTRALADAERTRNEAVPLALRNAATELMKDLGYGRGYQYAHDFEEGAVPDQRHRPPQVDGNRYYIASPRDLGAATTATEHASPSSWPPAAELPREGSPREGSLQRTVRQGTDRGQQRPREHRIVLRLDGILVRRTIGSVEQEATGELERSEQVALRRAAHQALARAALDRRRRDGTRLRLPPP